MLVGKGVDMFEKLDNLTVIFQEANDWFIQSSELFVWLIAPRVVCTSAIEHISTTIARRVFRNTFAVGKTIDSYHERPLAVVL